VAAFIKKAEDVAKGILQKNIDKLHDLAKALLEKEIIDGTEVDEIIGRPSGDVEPVKEPTPPPGH